eukprot:1194523-Prorocentrum_minimum.AAC.2
MCYLPDDAGGLEQDVFGLHAHHLRQRLRARHRVIPPLLPGGGVGLPRVDEHGADVRVLRQHLLAVHDGRGAHHVLGERPADNRLNREKHPPSGEQSQASQG